MTVDALRSAGNAKGVQLVENMGPEFNRSNGRFIYAVKANKGVSGVDGETLAEIEKQGEISIAAAQPDETYDGTWQVATMQAGSTGSREHSGTDRYQ